MLSDSYPAAVSGDGRFSAFADTYCTRPAGAPMPRRRSLSSQLFRAARIADDVEASHVREAEAGRSEGAKNVTVGRAFGRAARQEQDAGQLQAQKTLRNPVPLLRRGPIVKTGR
jgi:hypothetical protein